MPRNPTDPITRKLQALRAFIAQDAGRIIGVTAVNHFEKNFQEEAFDGAKWQKPKRRDRRSAWYGFDAGATTPPPSNHPKRRGSQRPYRPRTENPTT